jgi:hypothetical protein
LGTPKVYLSLVRRIGELTEAWRRDYNEVWPHSSLGGLTPIEFVANHQLSEITLAASGADLPE